MQAKAYKGLGMEGWIARWYARITGKDQSEIRALAGRIRQRLAPGDAVLEVAPGPGYLAIELARERTLRVSAVDISRAFVEMVRHKADEAGVDIDVRRGDAAHLPFDDDCFQFLVCRAAFKNFADPVGALREMHRVLAPGGTALIVDLRSDASPADLDAAIREMHLGAINARIVKWTFRCMLLKRAYSRDALPGLIAQSGFTHAEIQQSSISYEVYLLK